MLLVMMIFFQNPRNFIKIYIKQMVQVYQSVLFEIFVQYCIMDKLYWYTITRYRLSGSLSFSEIQIRSFSFFFSLFFLHVFDSVEDIADFFYKNWSCRQLSFYF